MKDGRQKYHALYSLDLIFHRPKYQKVLFVMTLINFRTQNGPKLHGGFLKSKTSQTFGIFLLVESD